jgi:uncharacterized membrane protein YkvI
MNSTWALLVPGVVFQSILIGGGYASGREIMEYAAKLGGNGIFVVGLVGILFSFFMFLSFELARFGEAFEYRSWSKILLGRGWVLFDALFVVMAVIAIAVVTSTAGTTLSIQGGVPYFVATALVILCVVILSLLGTKWIVRYKLVGTVILYGGFIYFFLAIAGHRGEVGRLGEVNFLNGDWVTSGFIYAGYNFVVIPACLFSVTSLKCKKDVALASIVGGILAIVPMALLYFVLVGERGLVDSPLPLLALIKLYLSPWGLTLYYVVLIVTLVETGVGLIHAITDRIDGQREERSLRKLPPRARAGISLGVAMLSVLLAQVGIIALVANYYSVMAWGFLLLFALPLLYRVPSLVFDIGVNELRRP